MWKIKSFDKDYQDQLYKNIQEEYEIHPLICRLLSQRKPISDLNDLNLADAFFKKEYKDLDVTLPDIDKAVSIFLEVAKNKGTISLIGDYDVDGIVSSTMIKELCRLYQINCNVFIPSRLDHGYGLNDKTIKAVSEQIPPTDLLFILDCGSNNHNEIERLKAQGFKRIIIIDHHIIGDQISSNADALISWHLSDTKEEMCSTAEIFHFIRAVAEQDSNIDPLEFLTYAAVGVIADVSPLYRNNRILVECGLKEGAINNVLASGLNALLNECSIKLNSMTSTDVGFRLAPRINAVGRLDDPNILVNLLTEVDVNLAKKMAKHLVKYNEERKKIQQTIEDEVDQYLNENSFDHGILCFNKNWHIGVVGIVASRIAEKHKKPTLIVGYHNEMFKGSGRSIGDINLKSILDTCPEIFDHYGGHAAAVGVALDPERLDDCQKVFDLSCKSYLEEYHEEGSDIDYYDATLQLSTVNPSIGEQLRNFMYPYCKSTNPEPIFRVSNVRLIDVEVKRGKKTKEWVLFKCRAIQDEYLCDYEFKCWEEYSTDLEGAMVDLYFNFPVTWGNGRFDSFSLDIVDIVRIS